MDYISEEGIKELQRQKVQAYRERNLLVAALSKLFPAYLASITESTRNACEVARPPGASVWDCLQRTITTLRIWSLLRKCSSPTTSRSRWIYFSEDYGLPPSPKILKIGYMAGTRFELVAFRL